MALVTQMSCCFVCCGYLASLVPSMGSLWSPSSVSRSSTAQSSKPMAKSSAGPRYAADPRKKATPRGCRFRLLTGTSSNQPFRFTIKCFHCSLTWFLSLSFTCKQQLLHHIFPSSSSNFLNHQRIQYNCHLLMLISTCMFVK